MTSAAVFLSYSQRDHEHAVVVAAALERAQYKVWWDRNLQAGDEFPAEIEAQVRSAACVVVLWSEASVASRWVRAEATIGANREVLVPLLIDGTNPPLEFINIQTLDISDWLRSADSQIEQLMLAAIARRSSAVPPNTTRIPPAIISDRVAELQRHLLSGPTTRELTAAAYELEAFTMAQPSHVRARMLLADYRVALERDRVRSMPSMRGDLEHGSGAPLRIWHALFLVGSYLLVATTISNQVFGLDVLPSALVAIGLPIGVWFFFVLLASVINLCKWIRDRLGNGNRDA